MMISIFFSGFHVCAFPHALAEMKMQKNARVIDCFMCETKGSDCGNYRVTFGSFGGH